jgi:hypothetical protein
LVVSRGRRICTLPPEGSAPTVRHLRSSCEGINHAHISAVWFAHENNELGWRNVHNTTIRSRFRLFAFRESLKLGKALLMNPPTDNHSFVLHIIIHITSRILCLVSETKNSNVITSSHSDRNPACVWTQAFSNELFGPLGKLIYETIGASACWDSRRRIRKRAAGS